MPPSGSTPSARRPRPMSAQAQRRRPRAREHAAAQAQRVRRARAAANGMSPSAPRSATKSPRVRTASPQARRVITLDSYEESKGEDAEAEVARLEAQLEEARRRAYEKRTGKPAPPRKVQFAESGDWSESWHELAEDRAAQYPEDAPPPRQFSFPDSTAALRGQRTQRIRR